METLKELYKIGPGPSSSHTLAPYRTCMLFIKEHPHCARIEVDLHGSLSLTGKGHFTDQTIKTCFPRTDCQIHFMDDWDETFPNGFRISGFDSHSQLVQKWTVFSIGGGSIKILERPDLCEITCPYGEQHISDIIDTCARNHIDFVEYVNQNEPGLDTYLGHILDAMLDSVARGLNRSGVLPGSLRVERSAQELYARACSIKSADEQTKLKRMAYAYAASEENAGLGQVVTAPTLGACGVLAATLYHYCHDCQTPRASLIDALKVAGLFGNVVKTNATISGAVGGCQAEIGVACCMSAAACAHLNNMGLTQIEYAAEIAMEHHLGLTCDPVGGYVVIPCIERNAVAVLRAFDAMLLAKHMSAIKENRVRFDTVVRTMNYTGSKLAMELRETSLGGLAKEVIVITPDPNKGRM